MNRLRLLGLVLSVVCAPIVFVVLVTIIVRVSLRCNWLMKFRSGRRVSRLRLTSPWASPTKILLSGDATYVPLVPIDVVWVTFGTIPDRAAEEGPVETLIRYLVAGIATLAVTCCRCKNTR